MSEEEKDAIVTELEVPEVPLFIDTFPVKLVVLTPPLHSIRLQPDEDSVVSQYMCIDALAVVELGLTAQTSSFLIPL